MIVDRKDNLPRVCSILSRTFSFLSHIFYHFTISIRHGIRTFPCECIFCIDPSLQPRYLGIVLGIRKSHDSSHGPLCSRETSDVTSDLRRRPGKRRVAHGEVNTTERLTLVAERRAE